MRIVFFGDSITEGCFELFDDHCGGYKGVTDAQSGYVHLLSQRLSKRFPHKNIEVLNAGIGGNTSSDGLARVKRDVIDKKPDIAVVCFGLNDILNTAPEVYKSNIDGILCALRKNGIKSVFMTPNMVNTYVHNRCLSVLNGMAKNCAECQNNGTVDMLMNIAVECAKRNGAEICDVYSVWKQLQDYGIDTTGLLSNYINHPIRPMHKLFADELEKKLSYIIENDKEN